MATEESSLKEKRPKLIFCTVVSDKMNKTRVGVIERLVKHPRYMKYIRRTSKVMFHDEGNESRIGDKVSVLSSRPISARKRFTLDKVIGHSLRYLELKELGEDKK